MLRYKDQSGYELRSVANGLRRWVKQESIAAKLRETAKQIRSAYTPTQPFFVSQEPLKAIHNGQQVGFAKYSIARDGQTLHIDDTQIFEGFRGQGHGKKLFEDLVEVARQKGIKRLTLTALNDGIYFWTKHGFDLMDNDMPEIRHRLYTRFNSILLSGLPKETNAARIYRSVLEGTNSKEEAKSAWENILNGKDMFLELS